MTLTADDARHLMRRAGYGALSADVSDLTGRTRTSAVDRVISRTGAPSLDAIPVVAGSSRTNERRAMTHWWVEQMTVSPAPIVERLTYFWHSHFACSSDRVKDQRNMRTQHRTLRQYCTADFHDLCQRIAVDPAMLIDLDNASNVAGDEQENFARELMELYTIGNGMFTEDDVISMARAWTGHGLVDGSKPPVYAFHSNRHDKHDKTLFGITRKWDGPETITELINGSRRADTAWFLSWKLWREFGDPSWWTNDLIDRLANTMMANQMSALAVVKEVFLSDEFWAPERRYAAVKQPLAWIVELQRRTGLRLSSSRLDQRCAVLGQQLFLPPSVAGWPHNSAWLSPTGLLGRARGAYDLGREINETAFLAGIESKTPSAAAQQILDAFAVPDASAQTRQTIEEWHTQALEDLNATYLRREAFRVGAMLPEVNLA